MAVADPCDQLGEGLRRVDRVDENPLGSRQELRCFLGRRRGHAIARAALGVGEVDLGGVDRQPDQRSEALEQRRDRRSQLIRRRGNGDTNDARFRSRQSQPGEDTGLGPTGRRRQDDDRRRDARRLCLPSNLDPREHLARRTGRSGPADPDHERTASRRSQIPGNARYEGLAIGADICRGDVDRGAEQCVQDFVRSRW